MYRYKKNKKRVREISEKTRTIYEIFQTNKYVFD